MTDQKIATIDDLLAAAPAASPALGEPGRPDLEFGALRSFIAETRRFLRGRGVDRGDRVAIVLPNGPEMAAAFLAVASAATTAPLNPAYREEEFAYYMRDVKARALITSEPPESPACRSARALGMSILRLDARTEGPAGGFSLDGEGPGEPLDDTPAQARDCALVLHTSGTTARPKIVPLTQANLTASASNIAATLALTAADRCLNIMPLFHIHGLVGCLLSSLGAGASVVCTRGFEAFSILDWLQSSRATWYSGVPTMHQASLARILRRPEDARALGLRFIRSSSASLPASVMAAVEGLFDCPVIESYGMTEAAHQMTSNELPPGKRKAGSVGRPAGPEVAIVDETGTVLEDGARGEVAIRGPNVMSGYEANEDANARAFVDGWFRTGDEGCFDEDGFLTITGRLKEMINRGGEKISPREIDEALLAHPAIVQAVAFALPHRSLGEDVAAAVVAEREHAVSESELRAFLSERLAAFKVPRRIVLLEEIPKGPTGKIQRIGLAERLGLLKEEERPA